MRLSFVFSALVLLSAPFAMAQATDCDALAGRITRLEQDVQSLRGAYEEQNKLFVELCMHGSTKMTPQCYLMAKRLGELAQNLGALEAKKAEAQNLFDRDCKSVVID